MFPFSGLYTAYVCGVLAESHMQSRLSRSAVKVVEWAPFPGKNKDEYLGMFHSYLKVRLAILSCNSPKRVAMCGHWACTAI